MKKLAFALCVAACGDNKDVTGTQVDAPIRIDAPPEVFDTLLQFNPSTRQLPEGVTVVGDVPYVGFAPIGMVVRVQEHDTLVLHGQIPAPVANTFTLGLAANPAGEIFVGVGASGAAPTPTPGIYKFPAAGGAATLFASSNAMTFPNGLDFDGALLFATDSSAGRVFEITANGQVRTWTTDALLAGNQMACGGSGAGFNIGANGLAHDANFRYVAVTDFGRLLKIPKLANGNAGTPAVVAEDCAKLAGIDGIALDTDGSILAVRNGPSRTMVRIAKDGTITELFVGKPLDGPASVAIDSKHRLLITNSTFFNPYGQPALLGYQL